MRNMIAANATLETRASSFGVGGFAYSALERDGWFSTPGFSVLSHRAHEYAPSFSLPVPTAAIQDGVLLRIAAELNVATAVDFSTLLPVGNSGTPSAEALMTSLTFRCEAGHGFSGGLLLSALTVTPRSSSLLPWTACTPLSVAWHSFGGNIVSLRSVAKQITASLDGFSTLYLSVAPHDSSGDSVSLTVTAPWFFTHARSSYISYMSPCRREARHYLSGGLVLPKFGRALRL